MNERILNPQGKLIGFRVICECGKTFECGVYGSRRELCDTCRKKHKRISQKKYCIKNPHRKEPKPKKIIQFPKKKAAVCSCCGNEPVMPGNRFLGRNCYIKY
jgi:hypothetical protein